MPAKLTKTVDPASQLYYSANSKLISTQPSNYTAAALPKLAADSASAVRKSQHPPEPKHLLR